MDVGLILARLLHVIGGVLWVGAIWFVSVFLAPSLNEAGPDAGKVMQGLMRRKFMIAIPVIAVVTMLSGLWLYWKVSAGFEPAYMGSGPGKAYGTGATLAILAFIMGMVVTRPAMLKAGALTQAAMSAAADEKQAMMAQADALRARATVWSKVIVTLLIAATMAMAVGRYV